MKHLTLLLSGLILSMSTLAQTYSKVKIYADSYELMTLSNAGVTIDHGKHKKDTWFISDFSEHEITIIDSMGIDYDVLIQDVKEFYKRGLSNDVQLHDNKKPHQFGDPHLRSAGRAGCGGASGGQINYPVPSNFSLGSMGGYFTYAEFIQQIDQMATLYPNLITTKEPIGPSGSPYQTHEGRDIYWLKISDNPNTDEATEPEVLYTSIHHAREPASLSETIYYMWYLLENYGTDDEVTYLVDNLEMFFVPMINPDGYIINETNDPSGGGLWRKNARDNDNNGQINGQDGVDLNRNYSYQWGVSGTSTNQSADNYLGPNPFSEPETQAIKWLCEQRDFEIAQNAHTYAALLLHPFGYATTQTADHTQFQAWTGLMVEQNGYGNILSADLYPAAGDSDDWMYAGDLGTKPKIFAMTPEVGEDAHGFWPATGEIQRICNDMIWQNLYMAHLALNIGVAEDAGPVAYSTSSGYIYYDLTRYGLDQGQLDVSIAPVGFGVATVGGANAHTAMTMMQTDTDSISFTLDAGLAPGQEFQVELAVSNGQFTWRDTLTKIYGSSSVAFADDGNTMNNWTSATWNTTTAEFYSPGSSITDSPGSNYSNNSSTEITLNSSIDLTDATAANATFYGLWDIEAQYDYVQLMASTDGGNTWTPLCGKYTTTGTNDQDPGEPLWDGTQASWVKEFIDLSDYLGQTIDLKFRLESDIWVNEDGFYFDDFEVNVFLDPSSIEENSPIEVLAPMPNPASTNTWIQYTLPADAQDPKVQVMNSVGQVVMVQSIDASNNKTQLNVSSLAEGIYLFRIVDGNYTSTSQRLSVVR